jgi:hypothetical protein
MYIVGVLILWFSPGGRADRKEQDLCTTSGEIMNRFLTVILSAALLSIVVQAEASVGARQVPYDGGIIAKIPRQIKGKLATGNPNLRFDYKATEYPIPYSSIDERVAKTAAIAVCGSCLFIHARRHFLTLEFTQNAAGNHGLWFSDRGFFLDQKAHGQENAVRGYQLPREIQY